MGAFADGFSQGRGIVNDAMDRQYRNAQLKIQQDAATRENTRFDNEQADRKSSLDAFGRTRDAYGLQPQSSQAQQAPTDAPSAGADVPDAPDAPQTQPAAAPAPTYSPARQRWRAAADLAIATRNQGALEKLSAEGKDLDWTEGLGKHMDDWDNMSDGDKAALIHKMSDDTGVHGYGTFVPGTGKQQGYMVYLAPGKDPVTIPNNEARQIYGLSKMNDVDPARAQSAINQSSDRVRGVFKDQFDAAQKGVTANNTAVHDASQDRSSMITAQGIAGLRDAQVTTIRDEQERRKQISPLLDQLNDLDVSDPQYGAKRRKLLSQIDVVNMKNGGQVSLRDPSDRGSGTANAKWETDNLWQGAEQKLIESNSSQADINAQRDGFYARRGFAPDKITASIYDGRDPLTGKKLTDSDVDNFNRQFPYSAVDKTQLPWMAAGNKPTSEAAPTKAGGLPPGPTATQMKILSTAGSGMTGKSRYNVRMPGGTTQVMSKDELEQAGYKFPDQ